MEDINKAISLHLSYFQKVGKTLRHCLGFLYLLIPLAVADWNILNQRTRNGLKISLKNYCEGWRMNVELHNIRDFEVVPEECTYYIGKYVRSTLYTVDSERATEECLVYLSTTCNLKKDSRDAWIFDIDETLLSTVPTTKTIYTEDWMNKSKAPALDHSLKLFNELKSRGVQIILVSARREHLRAATIDNLVRVGYHCWAGLVLRDYSDELVSVKKYKSDVRKKLISQGYGIWGIDGDQYSSIEGLPSAGRTFKLPNPMYYVA